MKNIFLMVLTVFTTSHATQALENTTCKTCHPAIYAEYQHSMHANASTVRDAIHKAVWDKHPMKKQGNYACAKCHTPSDHTLQDGKGLPVDNPVQRSEPISCQGCHRIKSIEKHAQANTNILTNKKKYFFSADKVKKGSRVIFHEERRFFGLIKSTTGSPYHDIDYSKEGYYTGAMCMGCHSHKQNSQKFAICDLEVKQGDSTATCISCHMPQTLGALANQKHTATHAYHGASIHEMTPEDLSQYVQLSVEKRPKGFAVLIHNKATHTLFPQPLRLNQLRVTIRRGDQSMTLPSQSFVRVIGTAGKATMPWLADAVIKDTTIKAGEKRKVSFDTELKKGDEVIVEFGYYLVNPAVAQKLGLTDAGASEFRVLTHKRFVF